MVQCDKIKVGNHIVTDFWKVGWGLWGSFAHLKIQWSVTEGPGRGGWYRACRCQTTFLFGHNPSLISVNQVLTASDRNPVI